MIKLYTENYHRLIQRKRVNKLDTLWMFPPAYSHVEDFNNSRPFSRKLNIATGIFYTATLVVLVVGLPILTVALVQTGFFGQASLLTGAATPLFFIFVWVAAIYNAILNLSGIRWMLKRVKK